MQEERFRIRHDEARDGMTRKVQEIANAVAIEATILLQEGVSISSALVKRNSDAKP